MIVNEGNRSHWRVHDLNVADHQGSTEDAAPAGERTAIGHLFVEFEADDQIDDIYVSTNRRFASEFERFIATSEFTRPKFSVEETASESEKLGVVGALARLIDREGIDDDLDHDAATIFIDVDVVGPDAGLGYVSGLIDDVLSPD